MALLYYILLAFPCVVAAIILAVRQIYKHLLNYTEPTYQRYIVRIIFMVPVFAAMSYLSLVFSKSSIYFDSIREMYEAWVIYNFLSLCLAWVGGPGSVVLSLTGRSLKPSWCLMTCCFPPINLDGRFIRMCKQWTLQFVILKPILVVITFIFYSRGKYKDGNFSPNQTYLYITIIYTISYSMALYALALFYMACKDLLRPFNPVPKFILIKSVVFLTYWQGVLVFLVAKSGFIKNTDDAAVGLLIRQWSRLERERKYDADYLRESGYVKIASDTLVLSVVRTNVQGGVPWEVEFSDSHIKVDTCSDTTWGIVCLISQIQQLFAPIMEDSLVHLQSRWSSTKKAHDILENSKMLEHLESSNEIDQSTGLMDEILDDFFHLQDNQLSHHVQSWDLSNKDNLRTSFNAKVSDQSAFVGISSLNATSSEKVPSRRHESLQNSFLNMPEIIESYSIPEPLPQNKLFIESRACNGALNVNSPLSGVPGNGKDGWYQSSSIIIDENYISSANNIYKENEVCQSNVSSVNVFSGNVCKAKGRILVKNIDVRWRMFSGSDWPDARKNRSSYLRSSTRDETACLELHLLGLGIQHDIYPDGEMYVSKLSLSLQEYHLHDNSNDAPWKMILGYYHSKYHTRESCAKSLKLDLESVRPDPSIPLEEYRLHLALLPIRLHLDQSQLNFLINFFGLGASGDESSDWHNEPDRQGMSGSKQETFAEEALLPFFQKCDIRPLVVRIDYIPRNIDLAALRGGNYIQLINLVHWKGIDLQLKHVNTAGIYGWGGVCEVVVGEWLEDISKNQVHKILKGLKPIQSFFSVTSGATKMVSLPIKNYKKDRRLIQGLQRGAITFLRSVTLEAVGLGVHLAAGAHDILLQTEFALASTPLSLPSGRSKSMTNVRSNQPKDAQQGMQQAYESIGDGLGRSASALVGTPMKTYQRGAGAGMAIASVIRSVPSAAVAPASAAARAVHCALLGVRNSLDPEHMKESMDKYLGSSQSQDHRQ